MLNYADYLLRTYLPTPWLNLEIMGTIYKKYPKSEQIFNILRAFSVMHETNIILYIITLNNYG